MKNKCNAQVELSQRDGVEYLRVISTPAILESEENQSLEIRQYPNFASIILASPTMKSNNSQPIANHQSSSLNQDSLSSNSFAAEMQKLAAQVDVDYWDKLVRDAEKRKEYLEHLQKENQKLRRLVNIDGLTQIANRRRFDQCLIQECKRAYRSQKPLSLIMCDVDYFQNYNNIYGHLGGDECLRQIAQAIHRILKRPADLVARYGGEEFAVILPETNRKGVKQVAKAIQMEIQGLHIPHAASKVSKYVTLSLGVATMIPVEKTSPLALISEADRALYQAKNQRVSSSN